GQVPMQMQPGQVPLQMQAGQVPMQMQQGQVPMQMQPGQVSTQMQPVQPSNGSSLFSFPEKLIDFNSARSVKTELDLESAQFLDAAVDRLHMTARNLDMRQGVVGALDLLVLGGHFQEFTVDQLRITSTAPLAFSTDALLNHRSFEFGNPVIANVSAVVSQNSLNKFLSAPRTLQILSAGAQNHLPSFLSELVGAALQVQFQSAKLNLLANNRVQIDVLADINLLKNVSRIPITVNTQLGLANGWVNLSDTQISSSGQPISPELSSMVVGRINNLAKWGTHNEDMQFAFTQINVIPGNRFELMGTAQIKRLRFGT
ncbi:MAG: hypothetical protein K2X81_01790, partial [Candidatus Obscuribacterales bacterium]|nr:hypothetical protein [Candidatus Obscuribacterales bacterium]